MRIEPIGLDLRVRYQPRLMRMSQHHLFHLLELLQLVVNQAPVPARFHYRFTWSIQTGKKLRKPACTVAFNSSFAQLAPALVQRAKHAVLLMYIHSHVVHENSFLSYSSLCTRLLLSFYLTPDRDY